MMWGYTNTWSWGGMALMTVSMLFWLAVIGLFLFLLMRWLSLATGAMPTPRVSPSARQLLEQRYARGEIDEATFQRMRDQLTPPEHG
jgi:putative membrane protein